jgi:imidazolonepropionase-like amidohydrolase
MMKTFPSLAVLLVSLLLAPFVHAQGAAAASNPQPSSYLFHQVRVFDGVKQEVSGPADVLIQANRIAKISSTPISPDADTKVIDGTGRTLMPGLIDAHAHIMLAAMPMQAALTADIGYINLVAAKEAQATLLRGFTSIRDLGGPSFGLKRGIDQGLYPGPRIYPSGAMISQTAGHGDFRLPYEIPATIGGPLSHVEQEGVAMIADGAAQVLMRTREQLLLGASQIKLMAGGGVSSLYDPLDAVQYTPEEIHAAVEAASNWNTYVTVHAYTPAAIQMAIGAGVKCIEHGQLADEATVKLMADKGIWWSLQPFLDDEDANKQTNPASRAKQLEVSNGTENAYRLAKKYSIKTAWGTDTLFSVTGGVRQNRQLTKLTRWYTPAEVLKMATHDNAELLALSGPRNPYPGKLGVVEEGALADLLLVEGDPVANIKLIETPETSFVVIMKDGKIYKNSLPGN